MTWHIYYFDFVENLLKLRYKVTFLLPLMLIKNYSNNTKMNDSNSGMDCLPLDLAVWPGDINVIQSFIIFQSCLLRLRLWLLFCLTLAAMPLCAQDDTTQAAASVATAQPAPDAETGPDSGKSAKGTLKVVIEGIENPLLENVQAFLDIYNYVDKGVPEEIRLRWSYERSEDEIRQALQPFGYFEPVIKASLNRTDTGDWEARYQITPGRPLRIAELDVRVFNEGANDPQFQKLLDNLPLRTGQTLEQPKYELIKANLESLATERGYFEARFIERKIYIDLQAYHARIRLHYDTGQRYTFGNILFQDDYFAQEFLARYPRFKPGDPYDVGPLLGLQGDLGNSGYFRRVEVSAPPEKGTRTTPVNVTMERNKKYKFGMGAGYGTDTGFRGRFQVERRWVNRWGHHYRFELGFSQIKSLVGFKYMIPGKNPSTDEYFLIARYTRQNYEGKEYQNYTIGGGLHQQDGKWQKNYSVHLRYEEFVIGERPRQETLLLVPEVDWTWVDADNRMYPRRGLLLGFRVRGAAEALLSDTSFLQGTVRMRGYYGLGKNNRLIVRGDLGMTAVDDFEKLPPSLRFFAGGDASVRGYAYESIGPTDPDGTVVGAKNLLVASLEYEHRVWKDWAVAAFIDTGDAFDDGGLSLKTGVGAGVRWITPIGPLRVDFASGLDRPPGDAFRFSFSIGPDL